MKKIELKFELFESEQEYIVVTDLDFDFINRARFSPALDGITKASLLAEVFAATTDTHLAAFYGGELYTSLISSEVIKIRHEMLLKRIALIAMNLIIPKRSSSRLELKIHFWWIASLVVGVLVTLPAAHMDRLWVSASDGTTMK